MVKIPAATIRTIGLMLSLAGRAAGARLAGRSMDHAALNAPEKSMPTDSANSREHVGVGTLTSLRCPSRQRVHSQRTTQRQPSARQ